jgi:hypothetical protein
MGGMGNCENAYITSRNVNIQCNPHENVNDILHINTKIKCKIQMETHTYTHTHTHTHTHKTQKLNKPNRSWAKRLMQEVSQYLTANYTTKP